MNGMARAGLPMCIQLAHIFPQNYIPIMVSQILLLTMYFPMNLFSAEYQKIFRLHSYIPQSMLGFHLLVYLHIWF